ncbi:MAG TPA: glycerol-3-phosphate acyltransferase [Trueperaceae bacterium]|nr:glycerol-3-phosphate acyltransferase [Trueperaceae bacterium]
MELLTTWVLPLLVAYAIGSLPLGAWLVQAASGFDPRDVNPHLLGVENVYKLVGPWVAVSSFVLDVLKGALGVMSGALVMVAASGATSLMLDPLLGLRVVTPWSLSGLADFTSPMAVAPGDLAATAGAAFFGVLFGHLHPLPLKRLASVPRGRGNGVIVGALAALFGLGVLPFWLPTVAVVVYSLVLARSGYVALASLAGLAALAVGGLVGAGFGLVGWAPALAITATTLLLAWRHRQAINRINDGTEARLGAPPPVRGLDPNTVLCAFMVHPLTYDDVWQPRSSRWLRWVVVTLVRPGILPERWLKRLFLNIRPQFHGVIEGIELSDGRKLRVLLISAPLMPDQFRTNPDDALRIAIQGARFAHRLGAEVVGLGAFWSTVGEKGAAVQEAVPEIVVTNGGAYTAATVKAAVPGLLKRFKAQGGNLKTSSAAVVGANGVVAFGVARLIASEVAEVVLIGRDRERLNRSADSLRKKYPHTNIVATTDIDAVAGSDLIFTATSDPNPVIFAHHVKPGAWIYDLGRPVDVDESVRDVPGVELVPGGVVRPPGSMRSRIDLRFGDGNVPACLAETMILTATGDYARRSIGNGTRSADIEFYLLEGERLGFEIVTRDGRLAPAKVTA